MKKRSLQFKLVVGGIVLVLIPLVVVGIFAVSKAANGLSKSSESRALNIATDMAGAVNMVLEEQLSKAAGLASTMTYGRVEGGSDVVIFGAGPIGLAAVQGARAQAAGQIIVIEPVAYRRDKALEFGATTVFDPNDDTATLVQRIRELCYGPTDRLDASERKFSARFLRHLSTHTA